MDQQSSARWLETLKSETRTKAKWEGKYLTAEQQRKEAEEEALAFSELSGGGGAKHTKSLTERDAMALRLRQFDDEENDPSKAQTERVKPYYEVLREKIAEEVARTRPRSHRFTGDLSTDSMLKDIGPGLWTSINPGYAPLKLASSSHRTHLYDKGKGWGESVDKKHHLKQDEFMQHAEKSLQLGEKVFVSGGMKLSKG